MLELSRWCNHWPLLAPQFVLAPHVLDLPPSGSLSYRTQQLIPSRPPPLQGVELGAGGFAQVRAYTLQLPGGSIPVACKQEDQDKLKRLVGPNKSPGYRLLCVLQEAW